MSSAEHRASCLCGAITIEVEGPLPAPDACHCTRCRKHSGHYYVSCDVPRDRVVVHGEEHLSWYASSEKVRRGFCKTCGASMLFDPIDQTKNDWIAISMGAFDTPTGVHIDKHIFVDDKGDYYTLDDGIPQNPQ